MAPARRALETTTRLQRRRTIRANSTRDTSSVKSPVHHQSEAPPLNSSAAHNCSDTSAACFHPPFTSYKNSPTS